MFSDKIFIVHVYALEISCLCPYKESEIPENDTSHFGVPHNLYCANQIKLLLFNIFFFGKNPTNYRGSGRYKELWLPLL